MNKIVIISGPTASRKTYASIELALHIKNNLQREVAIVNFDSLLFYKEISIGSAKPTI
jgi:tRNA dimethylallyltransferase